MRLLVSWDKSDLFLLLWIYTSCGFTLTSGWCNSKLFISDYLEIFFFNFAYFRGRHTCSLAIAVKAHEIAWKRIFTFFESMF